LVIGEQLTVTGDRAWLHGGMDAWEGHWSLDYWLLVKKEQLPVKSIWKTWVLVHPRRIERWILEILGLTIDN
jgi:hypothetical protein